jgi:hypothetical protein
MQKAHCKNICTDTTINDNIATMDNSLHSKNEKRNVSAQFLHVANKRLQTLYRGKLFPPENKPQINGPN